MKTFITRQSLVLFALIIGLFTLMGSTSANADCHGSHDPYWHNTSHYDYHPGYYQPHRDHYHYVPGHYDFHETGHYHW